MKKEQFLRNIPNMLSIIRLLMVPGFILLFIDGYHKENLIIPLVFFVVAGVTDVIDGYLARRNGWVTRLGKIIDPVADKSMQFAVLICLAAVDFLTWWMILPFFIKELATIIGGAIIIRNRKFVTISKVYGKAAVVMFYVMCGLNMLIFNFRWNYPVFYWIAFGLTVGLAVLAISLYARDYARFLKKEKEDQGQTEEAAPAPEQSETEEPVPEAENKS